MYWRPTVFAQRIFLKKIPIKHVLRMFHVSGYGSHFLQLNCVIAIMIIIDPAFVVQSNPPERKNTTAKWFYFVAPSHGPSHSHDRLLVVSLRRELFFLISRTLRFLVIVVRLSIRSSHSFIVSKQLKISDFFSVRELHDSFAPKSGVTHFQVRNFRPISRNILETV